MYGCGAGSVALRIEGLCVTMSCAQCPDLGVALLRRPVHAAQIGAMRAGFLTVVPRVALQVCTWKDLEDRVCGEAHIDFGVLRNHTDVYW
jgi:hypothetical protein